MTKQSKKTLSIFLDTKVRLEHIVITINKKCFCKINNDAFMETIEVPSGAQLVPHGLQIIDEEVYFITFPHIHFDLKRPMLRYKVHYLNLNDDVFSVEVI